MNLRSYLTRMMMRKGYAVSRYPLARFFREQDFDLVLDVGANRGQYAHELRKELSYHKQIISFEPMSDAFDKLQKAMGSDPNWTGHHTALGSKAGVETIHIAGNSASSSMFDMLDSHSDVLPHSKYVGEEEIKIQQLNKMFPEVAGASEKIMLKIDTQGFELEVLKGADECLGQICALQLELSLSPLYAGAPLFEEVIAFARSQGFAPYWFFPGFWNVKTHQQLQMDGLFLRV